MHPFMISIGVPEWLVGAVIFYSFSLTIFVPSPTRVG